MDLGAHLAPPLDRPAAPVALHRLHAAVERDPGHHLRVREVTARTANLPDALVRLLPGILEVPQQPPLQRPRLLRSLEVAHAALVHGVEHLAVDVELELAARGVPAAHGARALVAGQPVERLLGEPALAGDAVHDLQRRRVPGGRAQEPHPPIARLVEVAGVDEGEQRERGVAQPAVAVVPVTLAADPLR